MFYNILTKLALVLLLACSNIMLTACGSDNIAAEPSACELEQQQLGFNRVFLIQEDLNNANTYSRIEFEESDLQDETCRERNEPDCEEQREQRQKQRNKIYFDIVNKNALRECGTTFYNLDEEGNLTSNKEDFDNDGVSNIDEYYIGTNPCRKFSYYCEDDGSWDYDGDGKANAVDDDRPSCNFNQSSPYAPGTPEHKAYIYQSDCV